MQTLSFLSALPALLGLAGFVLYHVLGANRAGDAISRRIIDKVRAVAPDEIPSDQRLDAKQLERLLKSRHRLQEMVGKQDFDLLRQALSQQFIITIIAYVLALSFCFWSVYLFTRTNPKPPISSEHVPPAVDQTGDTNVISNGSGPVTVIKDDSTKRAAAPDGAVSYTKTPKPSGKPKDGRTNK